MTTQKSAIRFVLMVLVTAIVTLAGMIALPHDKCLRYQDLRDRQTQIAPWIYERIHYDRTPINIAFIGTSRTFLSIETKRLEERLAENGVHAKAANMAIVKTGRNMHYAIAKELLNNRHVDLLVLEITETEDRKPHPDFIYLADTKDVVFAPLLINLGYFDDLVRLPGRQIDLFIETVANKLGLRHDGFDPNTYIGPNKDQAHYFKTSDGVVHVRDDVHSLDEMEKLRVIQEASDTPPLSNRVPVFHDFFRRLEYRFPRLMMNRIIDLANAKGTKVVLLYLPRYGGPDVPPSYREVFADRAPLINPKPLLNSYTYWSDVPHLNWFGAERVTDYVADALVHDNLLPPGKDLRSYAGTEQDKAP